MSHKIVKLDDICIKIVSGGTPKSTIESFYNPKEIPWLKTGEVNYSRIYDTATYISQEGLDRSSAKLIPINSVIVAMYGQGDTAGRVAINKIPLSTNQACCNLIIDNSQANYEYIYYLLTMLYEKLVSLKNGGAQPNLNVKTIKNIEIVLPDLKVQNIVASILSAYDDLIENNEKQIKLLEEAAQRLYKEWFIDLRFPGHENVEIVDGVPEGWNIGTLGDIGTFKRGKTITKAKIVEGEVPVISGGLGPAYYHNESNTSSPVITVSGSGANAGFTRLYYTKVFASDCSFVDIEQTPYLYWIYLFLKNNSSRLDMLQKGSAQPHVYAKDINGLECIIPMKEILDLFCEVVSSYFDKIGILDKQIIRSTEARDRLLPKLMSGEIEV